MLRLGVSNRFSRNLLVSVSSKRLSSKAPNPKIEPVKLQAKKHDDESGFGSKFAAFAIFQGITLALFGVAHKMEDDNAFAKKVEGYYNIWGLESTLNGFRRFVRFVGPYIKKVEQPTTGTTKSITSESFIPIDKKIDNSDVKVAIASPFVDSNPSHYTTVDIEPLIQKHETVAISEETKLTLRRRQWNRSYYLNRSSCGCHIT